MLGGPRLGWFGSGRGRSRRGGGADGGSGGGWVQLAVLALAVVLALLAPVIARLVQMAVSREREYLADATAVEITRNPAGLERALAKIEADAEVLEAANRATQHLYFVNPIKHFEERARGLFSTHPATVLRVNRLRALRALPPVSDPREVLAAARRR